MDEVQDTDPVQMDVVESLCGGELTAGKLFGVGDSKQSIYQPVSRSGCVALSGTPPQRCRNDGDGSV